MAIAHIFKHSQRGSILQLHVQSLSRSQIQVRSGWLQYLLTQFIYSLKLIKLSKGNKMNQSTSQLTAKPAYEVTQTLNYINNKKYGVLLSQPSKFLGNMVVLNVTMGLVYAFSTQHDYWYLALPAAFFHLMTIIFMLIIARVDPGFLSQVYPTYEREQLKHIPIRQDWVNGSVAFRQPQIYSLVIKTHSKTTKFCDTCLIYRPPRAAHCYECNTCIQKYDHHCPWIGTCVGKRNYKYFLSYLISLTIMLAFVIALLTLTFIHYVQSNQKQKILHILIINIFLCLLTFLAVGFVYVLLGLHFYLGYKSQTTYEFCKDTWNTLAGNSEQKSSCWKHIVKIFSQPSLMNYDPKAKYYRRSQLELEQKMLAKMKQQQVAEKTIDITEIKLGIGESTEGNR